MWVKFPQRMLPVKAVDESSDDSYEVSVYHLPDSLDSYPAPATKKKEKEKKKEKDKEKEKEKEREKEKKKEKERRKKEIRKK